MITMSTITVHREWGAPSGPFGRMTVVVDGTPVATLRSDGALDVSTGAGPHTVRVVMGWQASATVGLDLAAGEQVWLRVRADMRAHTITGIFRRPDQALDLERLAGRPHGLPVRSEHVDLTP